MPESMHTYRMRDSIEPRDWIYVKVYRFSSFTKNMSRNLSSKHGQKPLDTSKRSATDALKAL